MQCGPRADKLPEEHDIELIARPIARTAATRRAWSLRPPGSHRAKSLTVAEASARAILFRPPSPTRVLF